MKTLLAMSLLLFFGTSARAATKDWRAACDARKNLSIPKADLPVDADKAALKGCLSESLYYGIGMAADPVKARACALLEGKDGPVFGGPAILMMIYANGTGVARDFDLAIHFACQIDGAPAEMESRVEHLEKLKANHWGGHDFDLCQDISSGFMSGQCAAHDARMASGARNKRLAAIAAAVPVAAKTAFDQLNAASEAFIKARVDHEVDLSGTARSMFQIQEEQILHEDFVQMLEAYAKGKQHKYTKAQARDADARLKKQLAKVLAVPAAGQSQTWGTVTRDGIRKTQDAWTGYRDAFATYVSVRYKGAEATSVRAWLTIKRIHMLKQWE